MDHNENFQMIYGLFEIKTKRTKRSMHCVELYERKQNVRILRLKFHVT